MIVRTYLDRPVARIGNFDGRARHQARIDLNVAGRWNDFTWNGGSLLSARGYEQ